MLLVPSSLGTDSQTFEKDVKNELNNKNTEQKDIKQVGAATTYKKWYKVWYKYKGRWRYYWKYKYVKKSSKTANAASSYIRTTSTYSTSGWGSDAKMDDIIRSGARFRYKRYTYHTGAQMEKYGYGDCWAMADYLVKKLNAAGYTAKVAPAPGTGNHRHAFVLINGRWVKVPYGNYGISRSFG